jgi:hypothetical protein
MAEINTIQCSANNTGSVDFNLNTPSIGQVWSTSNIPNAPSKTECVTITSLIDEPSAGRYLISDYIDCYDCQVSNYFVYRFIDCVRGGFAVTAESFGFSPTVGEVYYFTYSTCNELRTTCATLEGFSYYQSQEALNSDVANCNIGVIQGTPVLQTDCPTCLQTNTIPHLVNRCTDGEVDCVLLLDNTFDGHLISYSNGIDQYCGVVVDNSDCGGPYFNFIQDYGLSIDNEGGTAECIDCLSTETQKIKLVNCLDSEQTEVVWASAFYGAGDVSNLSLDNGCYEVSGYTIDEDVTINNFFNFEPQPGCDPCVECNGVVYDYILCNDEVEVNYQLRSFQSLSANTFFYDPLLDGCAKIVGTSSGYYGTVYSVETFEDCPDCNTTADINYWQVNICAASGTSSSYYVNVTTDSTVTTGDIVKLMWGSNEWVCGEITSTSSGYYNGTYYNTQKNGLGTTLIYDTCENCNSQGAIGITLLSCDIPYTESFVQITLENYLQIKNFGSLQNYSVSDQNGNCYTISNVCPIPLNSNEFTPVGFYFNCTICDQNTPEPARSAGTEVFICEICCDCGATGSTITQVTPPHPVWTDGYGTAVTQLNMIVLGGPNGLNN